MSEQKPLPGSLEWIEGLKKQEEDLESSKKNKPPRIDEHLNLDETDKVDKRRRARHPAGHERTGAPRGTLTSGDNPEARDPGR